MMDGRCAGRCSLKSYRGPSLLVTPQRRIEAPTPRQGQAHVGVPTPHVSRKPKALDAVSVSPKSASDQMADRWHRKRCKEKGGTAHLSMQFVVSAEDIGSYLVLPRTPL